MKGHKPDRSNYFNYKHDHGKNPSCRAATCYMLLSSLGIADTYTFLINTLNKLPESYQQLVYKNPLATVKCKIQHEEDATPPEVMMMEAAHVAKPICLAYMTSNVALEEPEIRGTDPSIPRDDYFMDDELHLGMPGGCEEYADEGGKID